MDNKFSFEALLPKEMAHKVELAGVAKARLRFWPMFDLAVLTGGFIARGRVCGNGHEGQWRFAIRFGTSGRRLVCNPPPG